MRKPTTMIVFVLVLTFITAFANIPDLGLFKQKTLPVLELQSRTIQEVEVKPVAVDIELKSQSACLKAIGFRESGNRYDVVNQFGYMGKYQFGKSTLKGLGIKVNKEEFLSNHVLQEQAMMLLLTHNKKKLQKYIDKYEGQYLHGILITESGVLAAAHLAGAGNVKKFFRKGHEFKDGLGTSMTSYMIEFGGYLLTI